jgi:hypothetical protein
MMVPKVFISYSHDSFSHKKWILELATRMRNNGIDAIIDQWELQPGDDLPHFMETHLSKSDKIIMVCTEKYVEKANAGIGGVGYEKMIITSTLLKNIDENKIIPIVKQVSTNNLPTFLKSKLYLDFSNVDDYEFSFDELIRTIHKSPLYKKPPIGNKPFKEVESDLIPKTQDAIQELMKVIIKSYNKTKAGYINRSIVHEQSKLSKLMFEHLLDKVIDLGYIELDRSGDIVLSKEGKNYAINNNLA